MPDFIQNWDIQVFTWVNNNHAPILTWIAAILSLISNKAATVWLLIPIFWFSRHKALAFRILMALGTSSLLGLLVKPIFARQRPSVVFCQLANKPFPEFLTTHYSFPSGHVLLLAAAAFVITRNCKRPYAIGFWIFTILVCWARVYDKMHWPTDCLGGILFGIVFAALSEWLWKHKVLDYIFATLAKLLFIFKLPNYLIKAARQDEIDRRAQISGSSRTAISSKNDLQPVRR